MVGYPAATSAVLLTVHVALMFILNEGVTPWLAIYCIMGHHNLKQIKHPKIMTCINDKLVEAQFSWLHHASIVTNTLLSN